jgi:hypothetical protein
MSSAGRARVPAAALVAVIAAAACGSDGPREDPLVASVRAGIAEQLGLAPQRVSCAGVRCEVEVGGLRIAVAVAGDREVEWSSDEVVLAAPLVAHIAAELDELGVVAAIDCGPPVQPVPASGRLACKLGDGGLAWVRLTGDGGVDVEVALTPEVVSARTTEVDDGELERMSRALDRPDFDEDGGVPLGDDEDTDDEGDDEGFDAGAGRVDVSRGPRG